MPRKHDRHTPPNPPTDSDVRDAVAIIQRDYYADVNDVADSIEDAIKDKEVTDRDGFEQRLDEEIDSHGRVMYTWQNRLGLLVSDNVDAYFEDYGSEGACEGEAINYAKLMFAAMRKDVLEELERRDVDPSRIGEED